MSGITLLNMDADILDELNNNVDSFEKKYNVIFNGNSKLITDISTITFHMISERRCRPEWGGYLAIENESKVIVGTCAFKGNPNEKGEIEIAFFTFPKKEGKGFGTMMTKELIRIAEKSSEVKVVFANSSPEKSPATRILEKCGMVMKGEILDSEDGKVWRWEYLINN
jgi:Acetyltransferases, including N-acetylases of ribosomal proteins